MSEDDYTDRMKKHFTKHPNSTSNPQSYCKHGIFAICNSFNLILAGSIGIIHGIFPFIFPFYTSSIVIESFKKILESNRHNNEVLQILGRGILNNELNYEKNFIIKHDNKAPKYNKVKNIQITIKVEEI